ncbi:aminopeptidase N [Corynebacterium sp.]|uniref:aminopeptidase N n=1 Tax=Corynebacterium sp. TaxID=1720 RepID=UPI0026DAABCA|nr:aminopeptidase N [Corynebacterium sp.]MDO4611079.1 aminopeptidase N [Corynebacterium sp.]
MSSKNLTRDEARARAGLLEVRNYGIDLDFTRAANGAETFRSVTTVSLTARRDGATFLDLRDADVRSVTVDGADATGSAAYDSDRGIALELTAGAHEVVVDADCRYTSIGQGIHRFTDPADGETYLYSQFETADAKRVFACFDQPDLKATYDMAVTAPEAWTVVSNSLPEVGDAEDGTRVHRFRIDVPLSTYLVAFCAGPWYEVRDEWRGTVAPHPETPREHQPDGELVIPLGLYCRQSLKEHLDTDVLFRETKEGFSFYARHFGEPYPFGKYDQVFCPEYNMGAMENAGCVTIRDEYLFRSRTTGYLYERRNDTILHEMAHMWFGDLVTMEWWDDLWLNESFATWTAAAAQVEVSEYSNAWATFCNVEKAWAYQQDQLPSTHPIAANAGDIDTVEQNFDGITYAKGASVLKQLVAYVGEEAFLAGARLHFARHRFANATFDDLLSAMSETSGRDLSDWAGQWLTTTGVNTLTPEFERDDAGRYSSFRIRQEGAEPGAGELRDHRVAVGVYELRGRGDDEALVRVAREEIDVTGELTDVPALVGVQAGDVVLVNDDDLTYCLMGLDERSLETVVGHIGAFRDPMPRTLAWSAAWQMTRGGRMRARDFMDLVLRGAAAEDQVAVLERVLAQAVQAAVLYADADWAKATGIPSLATGLLASARAAEPGSDAQLAFVKALAMLPADGTSPAILDAFRAIHAGHPATAGLAGLTVDEEMMWRALTVLVAAGELGEDAIAAAEAADNSASGRQSAAHARAARPFAEVKAETWEALTATGTDAVSNLQARHMLLGFTAPGSAALLRDAGFTDRYFAEAVGWWDAFSSETAANLLKGLFPSWEIDQATVDRARAIAGGDATPGAVRRILSEQADQVARALHNREVDAR